MICKIDHINGLFASNPHMETPPYIKGMTHAEATKEWTVTKIILARKIWGDMDKCEVANGNEFANAVWVTIAPQLAKTNFNRPCGVYAIWKAIYKKASAKAEQDLKQPQRVNVLMKDLLDNSLVKVADFE